jgi:hypothetical protein
MCGAAFTDEDVECPPTGTVATFLVVNVPFASQEVEIPYTAVEVLFDGAHTTSQFLLLGAAVEDVRMGMRVRGRLEGGRRPRPDPVQRHPRRTDRRTRRRLRVVRRLRVRSPHMRDVAIVSFAQFTAPEDRPASPNCCSRSSTRRCRGRPDPPGDRLHLLRVHRLPRRAAVLVRRRARRRRGVAADRREPRRDGRGVGAVRGVAVAASGDADTALVYAFGKTSRRTCPARWRCSSSRTRSGRCSRTATRSPACRPARCSTPGRPPRTTSPPSRRGPTGRAPATRTPPVPGTAPPTTCWPTRPPTTRCATS